MASLEPFNRVVRLTARAFYDDIFMNQQTKTSRGDNRGVAVVVLDALTRTSQPWVREEDLAKALKLHSKQLRRILRFLEEDKLLTRCHRKESTKGRRENNASAAATDGQPAVTKEEGEKTKMHTHSYCCLDYAQICDVVRYRIHRVKKKLKDDLDSRNTIQHYICPSCNKRYSAFDALHLASYTDEYFHCESCNGVLVAESDNLACVETGDSDDSARKLRHEKLKDMLQRVDVQLKPLITQLDRVKNLPAPEFGSLQSWEISNIGPSANGCLGVADSSSNSQGPEVEVKIDNGVKKGAEYGKNGTGMKILPPWLNLDNKQRGEANVTLKLDGTTEDKDDKSQDLLIEKSVQEEYGKAYYEALRKMQEEEYAKRRMQEEGDKFVSDSQSDREVGKKNKRVDEDEGIEWENEQPPGNTAKIYKMEDFNPDVQESGNDEDGIVWEEGCLE